MSICDAQHPCNNGPFVPKHTHIFYIYIYTHAIQASFTYILIKCVCVYSPVCVMSLSDCSLQVLDLLRGGAPAGEQADHFLTVSSLPDRSVWETGTEVWKTPARLALKPIQVRMTSFDHTKTIQNTIYKHEVFRTSFGPYSLGSGTC